MKDLEQADSHWHVALIADTAKALEVDPAVGLTTEIVQQRLASYGANQIEEAPPRPIWRLFAAQFMDFMILVLVTAAVVAGLVGEPGDAITIMVIVILNAIVGSVQEYRAERAVAALRRMFALEAQVRRQGRVDRINARDLVPGDIVLLDAGSVVPADLRLSEVFELRIDESALTGESLAADKIRGHLSEPELPLGDRRNMAYKGTLVTNGRGEGIVVATGMETELGKIAALLQQAEAVKTPLQKRLAKFGQRLALVILVICALVFTTGLFRGEPVLLMFLTAVSLAVAAIPEALPAVVTVALALGARLMVTRHALVRRLPAVETCGSVTFICSDKTGTLTQNKMRAEVFYADGQLTDRLPAPKAGETPWTFVHLGKALALNNDARIDNLGHVEGDSTEVALFKAARDAGFEKTILEVQTPRVGEIPFDADRKCMTTLHREGDEVIAYVKGAPEVVLSHTISMLSSEGSSTRVDTETILARAEELACQGYRVLAVAYREVDGIPASPKPESLERDLTFIGLVGLIDPPREGVATAVEECRTAGITPVMITGDHPGTAKAIALRLGIATDHETVITGPELDAMSQQDFAARVRQIRIYARVTPAQKIRIVSALQEQGEYVAMTGDGVNDAPALKRADIGLAMGKKGTDVAREAADMVLLDDNFSTIVAAVREGRRVFDNIRKFVKYVMTGNSGEIWTIFLAPFLGLPIPLLPIQILWVNLVTDGLPGLALSVEREERGVMHRPPRQPSESIFAHGIWQHMIWVGLLIGGLSLGGQAWAYHAGSENWQTVVFTILTFSQLVHATVIRSERYSLFDIGLGSNLPMLGAVLLTICLQLIIIYIPLFQPIFKTTALNPLELIVCFTVPGVVLLAVELEKLLVRRGLLYQSG
jgi:Ca2+-transporting ATPase